MKARVTTRRVRVAIVSKCMNNLNVECLETTLRLFTYAVARAKLFGTLHCTGWRTLRQLSKCQGAAYEEASELDAQLSDAIDDCIEDSSLIALVVFLVIFGLVPLGFGVWCRRYEINQARVAAANEGQQMDLAPPQTKNMSPQLTGHEEVMMGALFLAMAQTTLMLWARSIALECNGYADDLAQRQSCGVRAYLAFIGCSFFAFFSLLGCSA